MTPASVSPATPSDFSTSWQNWWVVAIVAASKPASASRSRCLRSARSAAVPPSRCATTWLSPTVDGSSKATSGADDLAADPLAQLLAGRPPERDEQHLVQRRRALGDIPRHQTGERERLARARAGFQHRGGPLGRQRAQAGRRAPSRRLPGTQHRQPDSSGVRAEPIVFALVLLARSQGLHEVRQLRAAAPRPFVRRRLCPHRGIGRWTSSGIDAASHRVVAFVPRGRPRVGRLDRQRNRLAASGVVDRYEIAQQLDGILRRAAAPPAAGWCPAWPGRCRRPTSRGSGRERSTPATESTTRAGACRPAWNTSPPPAGRRRPVARCRSAADRSRDRCRRRTPARPPGGIAAPRSPGPRPDRGSRWPCASPAGPAVACRGATPRAAHRRGHAAQHVAEHPVADRPLLERVDVDGHGVLDTVDVPRQRVAPARGRSPSPGP